MEHVPLVEQSDVQATAAGGGPMMGATSQAADRGTQQGVEFSLGGQSGEPAVRIGSLRLGYQDILLILVLLQAVTAALTAVNLGGR